MPLNSTGSLPAVSVVLAPSVTSPVKVCASALETVSVLMRVVPVTSSVVKPVTLSVVASPKTALPVTSRL